MSRIVLIVALFAVAGCERLDRVGRAPDFSALEGSQEYSAMYSVPMPEHTEAAGTGDAASLWSAGQKSLLGDRRARERGDILTVVIEIDDQAEMSNRSNRSRSGSESLGIPSFFGLPQRIDGRLPDGAGLADAVSASSAGSFSGDGSVRRNEKLTLRVATTVVERLPNGVLRIEGTQEVRVNNELRELVIGGFVRPEDISRRNEVSHDKIAGARIAYGGRGLISDAQRPRWGQEITDIVLPF